MTRVVVFGGTGFVGSAIVEALTRRGVEAMAVSAPRLAGSGADTARALDAAISAMSSADAAVNAAGVPDATGGERELMGANGELPGVLAHAAERRGIRLVHVSSAAVQGDVDTLDDAIETSPFSPYSRSKAEGERGVLAARHRGGETVVYRPPGVHHPSRHVTRQLTRIASSPFSSVAHPGGRGSAQALLENVADAVAFLATCGDAPPPVVHHPSEQLTTSTLLTALGGKQPRVIPAGPARALVDAIKRADRFRPGIGGHARRLEMLWFGQSQARSWLEDAGWQPVLPTDHWALMGHAIRTKEKPA